MREEIPMSEDEGYSLKQQQEQQQWEKHEKDLKELENLLGEGMVISKKFDFIFKKLKP